MPVKPPRVFISYSHDSNEHKERVRALADRLRSDGMEAEIDVYVGDPSEGWRAWMWRQIRELGRHDAEALERGQRDPTPRVAAPFHADGDRVAAPPPPALSQSLA